MDETTSYVGMTTEPLSIINEVKMFHAKSQKEGLPENDTGAVENMLIDSEASLNVGPMDILHQRSERFQDQS